MKKIIRLMLVVFVSCTFLVGCASERKVTIEVSGFGNYEIAKLPDGLVDGKVEDNKIIATVNKDGDYKFVLKDEDGKKHTLTLKYHDNSATAECKDASTINLGVER